MISQFFFLGFCPIPCNFYYKVLIGDFQIRPRCLFLWVLISRAGSFTVFLFVKRLSAVGSVASLPERTTMASVACGFVSWYEVFVSSDRGRREVHYYLKRGDGGSDLAVVGKEKSLRHMTYHYALRDRFLSSSLTKLKSRREVVEWLSSVVSGTTASLSGISITEFLKFFSSTFFFLLPFSILACCLPFLVLF